MDELTAMMAESKVDPTALGEHPHFSKFKNANKAAQQQASRRLEYLERQKQNRHDHLCLLRKLDPNEELSDEETEATEVIVTNKEKYYNRRYADWLMLSEWLIDIPESLSEEWTMVFAPVGKRVLVVCSRGSTYVYSKAGRLVTQFKSSLPSRGGITAIDCILSKNNTIYCLDLLIWDGQVFTDSPFDLRRFWLTSKFQDNSLPTKGKKFSFAELPQCYCRLPEMQQLLEKHKDDYDLDGLLFYYSQALYDAGQSPLIGWLKPWMLPEILKVPIPEKFQSTENANAGEFIKAFNTKYGHVSKIEKGMDICS